MQNIQLSPLEKRVLNEYQHNIPLTVQPYLQMAKQLGVTEQTLLDTLSKLKNLGAISRIGAVFKPNRIGVSTLAAMCVPEKDLLEVAEKVNRYQQVNHNYEREHNFNMWFVLNASDQNELQNVLSSIEQETGYEVMSLPMIKDYHIDLGFDLKW